MEKIEKRSHPTIMNSLRRKDIIKGFYYNEPSSGL